MPPGFFFNLITPVFSYTVVFFLPMLLLPSSYIFDNRWGTRSFLCVLYLTSHGTLSFFCKPIALRRGRFALLSLLSACIDVILKPNPLAIDYEEKYEAPRSLLPFGHPACIDWSALAEVDPDDKPWA